MTEVFWSVDALVIRNNVIFGFGWVFHARHEIASISLRLSFASDDACQTEYILAEAWKPRVDVSSYFENQPQALNSGFVVYGAYRPGKKITSIELVCFLEDGASLELAVPPVNITQLDCTNKSQINWSLVKQFYAFFKRGAQLARAKKLCTLFDKARRYFKGRPKYRLQKPTELEALFREAGCKSVCLIVDHDLGGGANQYRERLIESVISEGQSVIIVSYHVATLSHILILKNSRVNIRLSVPDKDFILEAVKKLPIHDVIYNTAVSFAKPEEIPYLLVRLKELTSARLRVLVHDFFLVCPSHFLIDHEGKHCHLPPISVCSGCLPKNQHGFATLFTERDITKWRSAWGAMLSIADEIVTFSNNSSSLLLKAYPHIEKSKISIVPHKDTHVSGRLPKITNRCSLRIGVVGQIGFHKGSLFIQSLAREIRRRGVDVKIVVIGTIEAKCDPLVVEQTGPYRHDEMVSLIEKSGANVFLFPSIWPETFSYVVQELMTMRVPVACFNLGAPAERLSTYQFGLILRSMDAREVLDELISFHRKLYLVN